MTLDPALTPVAREVLRRRIERAVGAARVRWSVLAALSNKEIVLLLADPALLGGLSALSLTWEQPPALCFNAAVDALAVDLGVLESRAKQVEALLTEPEGVSVLDAAIDAVIAGAPADWALTHTKASRADC